MCSLGLEIMIKIKRVGFKDEKPLTGVCVCSGALPEGRLIQKTGDQRCIAGGADDAQVGLIFLRSLSHIVGLVYRRFLLLPSAPHRPVGKKLNVDKNS